MQQYLDLLQHVLANGTRKEQRAVDKDGKKLYCTSIFGYQMRFDLAKGFPIVTTKKIPFLGVVHELKWFLSGSTNIAYLAANKIKIWDKWADENGELGPIYGKQWRRWEAPNGETVDQVANLVSGIKNVKADPWAKEARRLIISSWNPVDVAKIEKSPPFCHTLAQFMVANQRLSCHLYQRSADLFLGVPWNIACYSLFTHLLAHVTGLEVGEFIHSFGDAHIYENHVEPVTTQISRTPYPLPTLKIAPDLKNIDDFDVKHVELVGYQSHPTLKGDVAV